MGNSWRTNSRQCGLGPTKIGITGDEKLLKQLEKRKPQRAQVYWSCTNINKKMHAANHPEKPPGGEQGFTTYIRDMVASQTSVLGSNPSCERRVRELRVRSADLTPGAW